MNIENTNFKKKKYDCKTPCANKWLCKMGDFWEGKKDCYSEKEDLNARRNM